MNEQTLILTVGLPRSGKSTWARKQGCPVVCPDNIRLAMHGHRYLQLAEPLVWAIAKIMVRALFLSGHDTVILDATSNTKKRRDDWLDDAWTVRHELFDRSADDCIRQAMRDDRDELVAVINRMDRESDWR